MVRSESAPADPAVPTTAWASAANSRSLRGRSTVGASKSDGVQRSERRPSTSTAVGSSSLLEVQQERWGIEAADRFKVFSAMKSSFGRHGRETQGRQPKVDADSEKHVTYRCQPCQNQHTMNTTCC